MKSSIAAACVAALALCSCGKSDGGAKGGGLPDGIQKVSVKDIRQQCEAREDDYVEAFRSMGMESRAEPEKIEKVKKECCPALADASKSLSEIERAYLYNSMGAEMDGGSITPRQVDEFRNAQDEISMGMTSAQVTAASKLEYETFTQCKGRMLE